MLTAARRNTVPHVPRDQFLPVTHAQEERLVVGRHSHVTNNIVTLGLRLRGRLDLVALETAVVVVTDRHEGLRVVFPDEPGAALGLLPELPQPLAVCDVTDLSAGERFDAACELLTQEALRPVDLATGPLCRAMLVRVDDHDHVLGVAFDQYIVDRWAVSLFLDQLLDTYEAYARHDVGPADPPPMQFPDYAAWERAHLTGAELDRGLGYWRRKLEGIEPIPASGMVDQRAPSGAHPALARVTTRLAPDVTTRLTTIAERNGTSLVVVFAAATKAAMVLRRRAANVPGSEDVAVFGSLANRVLPGTEDMIGYLATPAVLRTDLTGDPTFEELVRREARTFWEAMWHQTVPHALITHHLAPHLYGVRHRGVPDEIPRYLNFDMADDRDNRLRSPAGLSVHTFRVPMPEVPRGGLRVIAHRHVDTASVELRYRTDLYREEWSRSFVADVVGFLNRGAVSPSTRLSHTAGD